MTSLRVVPSAGNWKIMRAKSNGNIHRTVSNHRTKQVAVREARRIASSGDSLTILASNGNIQSRSTVR